MTDREFIIEKFYMVKSLGYIESLRGNNTGIGKTFEEKIGVVENNSESPDLVGYEIKAQRELSSSYITLFTKKPSFPANANTHLRDKFGSKYEENSSLKKLHTSMFASHPNSYENTFSFQLINDRNARKLFIAVCDIKSGALIDKSCGYTYDELEKKFNKKLKKLFYVSAHTRVSSVSGREEFNYYKADIFENPSFGKFLDFIDRGLIMYDIRIGSYKSGNQIGKAHDHGSGFRILENNLSKLYSFHQVEED